MEYGLNRLYLNDGKARLTYVPGAFGDVIHDSEHVRAADFNGDHQMDVVFVAESHEVHQLFVGNGKGSFVDASDRLPASSQGDGLAVGDVNRDGLPDIVVGSTGETGHLPLAATVRARNLLFLNDAKRPSHFIDVTKTHLPNINDQTEGVALASMDGDGDLDMVLASPAHPNRNNFGWDKDPQTRFLLNNGKGRFRDETAELQDIEQLSFWTSPEQRVFALHGSDRLDCVGAANRLNACFRQTEALNLAGIDQIFDGACDVFDRHSGVSTVLIKDVDTIGAQALQCGFRNRLDVLRPAVGIHAATTGDWIDIPQAIPLRGAQASRRRSRTARTPRGGLAICFK